MQKSNSYPTLSYFNILIIHQTLSYSKFIKQKSSIFQSITFLKKLIQQITLNKCAQREFYLKQINIKQLVPSSLRLVFQYDQLASSYKTDRTLSNLSIQDIFFETFKSFCQFIHQLFVWIDNLPEKQILKIFLEYQVVRKIFQKILNFMVKTLEKDYCNNLNLYEIDSELLNIQNQVNQLLIIQKKIQEKTVKKFIHFLRTVILKWKTIVYILNIKIKIYMKVKTLSLENSIGLYQIFQSVSKTTYKFQLSYIIDNYIDQRQKILYSCLNCEKSYQHRKLFKHIKLCKQKYEQQKFLQNNYKEILPKLKDVQGIQAKIQKAYKEKSKQKQHPISKKQKKSQFFFSKKLSKSHNFKDSNQFNNSNSDQEEQTIEIQRKNQKTFEQLNTNQLKQLLKIIEKIIEVGEKIKLTRQSTNLMLIYDLRDIKLIYQQKFNKLKFDCPQVKVLIKLLIQRERSLQNLKKNQNKGKKSGLLIQEQYLSLQDLDITQNHTQPKKQLKFKKKKGYEFDNEYFSEEQIASPSAKYFDENYINLQQFEIIRRIGKGKYAAVYLVRKKTTDQLYAMKKIQIENYKQFFQKNKVDQKLLNQQCVFEITDSPFVVKAFYSFSQDQFHYFVMQYCPNGDFSQLLENQIRLTEAQSKLYLAEMVMALQYLHNKKIIHRDFKPHNIVLDSKWHAKLTDYGLSDAGLRNKQIQYLKPKNLSKFEQEALKVKRFFTKQPEQKKIVGSPYYMSPQIMRGQPATYLSDWWSFGILVYQTLIGVPPFVGKDRQQIYLKIIQNQLWPSCVQFGTENDMISYDAKNLIQGLLDLDPQRRLGSKIQQIKIHPFFKGIDWEHLLTTEPPALAYRQQLKQRQSNNTFTKKNLEETKSCNSSSVSRQSVIRRDHLNNDTQIKYNTRQAKYENLRKISRKLRTQYIFNDQQLLT